MTRAGYFGEYVLEIGRNPTDAGYSVGIRDNWTRRQITLTSSTTPTPARIGEMVAVLLARLHKHPHDLKNDPATGGG